MSENMRRTNHFEFTLKIKVNRDQVPGFGYTASSWQNYMFRDLLSNKHYAPAVEVSEVKYVCPDWEDADNTAKDEVLVALTAKELDVLVEERARKRIEEMNRQWDEREAIRNATASHMTPDKDDPVVARNAKA